MNEADLERDVRRLRWPEPTDPLRERVLVACRLVTPQVTWSDRLWFSRVWRIGCGAVASAAFVVASLDSTTVDKARPAPQAQAQAQAVSELAGTLGLPPDLTAALTQRALGVNARPPDDMRQNGAVLRVLAAEGERR